MAIEITERRLPLNADQVREFLQAQSNSFGVFLDLERCNEYRYIIYEKMIKAKRLAADVYGQTIDIADKRTAIEALKSFGIPGQLFGANNSLNQEIVDSIINNKDYSQTAVFFAKVYSQYKKLATRYNSLNAYVTKYREEENMWSEKGHRMLVTHPKYTTLSTSRQATSEPNVQALAKDLKDLIVAPKGYNLVRCDSNQIEPRITWSYFMRDELIVNLITLYGDAYFGLLAYCLLSSEEESKYRQDFSLYQKQEFDKEKRKQLKVLALAGAYGSSNLDKVDSGLASSFTRKITNHPKRLEWESKVTEMVDNGVEIFHGYFGTVVTPDSTEKYHRGTSGWKQHVIRCGINNPVQTTASELMNFSVARAMDILSRAKDSHVAFYKHDEACFYVSDEDKANGILDELADVTAYNVKGWIPIPCETEYGTLESSIPTFL